MWCNLVGAEILDAIPSAGQMEMLKSSAAENNGFRSPVSGYWLPIPD